MKNRWRSCRAFSRSVALCLLLALNACGERPNDRVTAGPSIEPSGQSHAPVQNDPPTVQSESQRPTSSELSELKQGPLTAEARNRVADLVSGDGRTVSEAQKALLRIGRDAVPALVEALDGTYYNFRAKQLAAGILGEMGVTAFASLPSLKSLKLRGPSEVSALVAPVILRIEQGQSCGLVGLPEDAEVHLVGSYKGPKRLRVPLGESGHGTTEIDVVVGRTQYPVILVLSAYDPVVWRVGYTSQSSIAGVLASGYHAQGVIGIPRDTPLRILSYEQTRGCETFQAYNPQTAAQAERRIMALVGRGIDKFYGSSPTLIGHVGGDSRSGFDDVTYSSDLTVDGYSAVRSDTPPDEQDKQDISPRRRARVR
jgi:hypothetical protein